MKTDWQVEPFDEERDLEEVVRRYDLYNAKQSGVNCAVEGSLGYDHRTAARHLAGPCGASR